MLRGRTLQLLAIGTFLRGIPWICLPEAAAAQFDHYHIVRRIVLPPGQAGLLAVDTTNHRLFGAGQSVIDIGGDTVIGTLPARAGYGFALAMDIGRGVTNTGLIFDLHTLKMAGNVSANAWGSAYDPVTRRVYLIGDTTVVVDPEKATIEKHIPFDGGPQMAVADGAGHVYVNLLRGEIARIDTPTMQVDQLWPLAGCRSPIALAIDRTHRRLFSSCRNHALVVVDADNGRIVKTVPTNGWAISIAFDPRTQLILHPNGHGTMTVIHEDSPDSYTVVDTASVAEAERAIALDEQSHEGFLYSRQAGDFRIIVVAPKSIQSTLRP